MRKYARDIFRTAEFFYKSYDERVDFLRINLAPGIVIPPGPVSIDNLGDPLDKLATRGFSAEVKRATVKAPSELKGTEELRLRVRGKPGSRSIWVPTELSLLLKDLKETSRGRLRA